MIAFPYTKRYFVAFGPTNTALTPSWLHFRRVDTLADVTPHPTITHVANGVYYFDFTWTLDDTTGEIFPDISWRIDGGAGADTGTRYPSGMLSSSDLVSGSYVKEIYDRLGDPMMNSLWNSQDGGGPGQLSTIADMVRTTWERASQLKRDILGGDWYGETWSYGPDLYQVSGAEVIGNDSTDFDPNINSVKYISENLGGGGGGTVDLTLIEAGIDDLRVLLQRALGMLHENSVLDLTSFTGGNLGSARLRLYDSAINAAAAQAAANLQPPVEYDTGKLAQYSINATYTGANLKDYLVTLEWLRPALP
jgi:hypothetical protein